MQLPQPKSSSGGESGANQKPEAASPAASNSRRHKPSLTPAAGKSGSGWRGPKAPRLPFLPRDGGGTVFAVRTYAGPRSLLLCFLPTGGPPRAAPREAHRLHPLVGPPVCPMARKPALLGVSADPPKAQGGGSGDKL